MSELQREAIKVVTTGSPYQEEVDFVLTDAELQQINQALDSYYRSRADEPLPTYDGWEFLGYSV